MNDENAEMYVEAANLLSGPFPAAGQTLIDLGRWLQRTVPKASVVGSQFEEDKILAELLPQKKGTYVDVGAYHSQECSNTWQFYCRGWKGLLIEPLPDCWMELLLHRRRDKLCPVAASNKEGMVQMRVCRSVSSLQENWPIEESTRCFVQTATLDHVLSLYNRNWKNTDLCSIDVEGHEKEVLEGIDWKRFYPKVLVIEYREYNAEKLGEDTSDRWKGIVEERYFLHHQNDLNQIWVRK